MRGWLLGAAAVLAAAGCGGGSGGGGGGATAVGRVLNVETGGALNPQGSVQIGGRSTLTSLSDGSFSLQAPAGSNAITVNTNSFGIWTFATPPLQGTTDVGDLWVGPERVTLVGRVLSSTTSQPVAGATVRFGGRSGQTNAAGVFSIPEVAYSSSFLTAFWGILGDATATGFFRTEFSAAPHTASGGVVDIGDLLLTPSSDPDPPGPPYNIWGKVNPPASAQGTIVTLREAGTPIRIFNVGSDGAYYFWVSPGTYTISYVNGSLTAPDETVVLTAPNQVVRRDVTLN